MNNKNKGNAVKVIQYKNYKIAKYINAFNQPGFACYPNNRRVDVDFWERIYNTITEAKYYIDSKQRKCGNCKKFFQCIEKFGFISRSDLKPSKEDEACPSYE